MRGPTLPNCASTLRPKFSNVLLPPCDVVSAIRHLACFNSLRVRARSGQSRRPQKVSAASMRCQSASLPVDTKQTELVVPFPLNGPWLIPFTHQPNVISSSDFFSRSPASRRIRRSCAVLTRAETAPVLMAALSVAARNCNRSRDAPCARARLPGRRWLVIVVAGSARTAGIRFRSQEWSNDRSRPR